MGYAKFIGYQFFSIDERDLKEFPPFPLYNVFDVGNYSGSTVGTETLMRLGVSIPPTPSFFDWLKKSDILEVEKIRAGSCLL